MSDRIDIVKSYLPAWLANQQPLISILNSEGTESGAFFDAIAELLNQCFVNTATWGLDMWETFVGIPTDDSKPYEYRRSHIISKIRGTGTVTLSLIDFIAQSYANGEVQVIEHSSIYSFEIKFTGERGIPPNLEDLKSVIDKIKPAHLGVTYSFTYTTWGEVKVKTWSFVKTGTWDELKIRIIV